MSATPSGPPKVAVVAEFYPSQRDPVLGVWAHRQALAARDAGAEMQVLVLHRLVPPRASFGAGGGGARRALTARMREPRRQTRDGILVTYVPYVSPPRERHYPSWGAWAAPALALALARLRHSFPYEVIHAHNAVPAGDAPLADRIAAAQAACGWDLQVAAEVTEIAAPTAEEVSVLRHWDPRGWFLRA